MRNDSGSSYNNNNSSCSSSNNKGNVTTAGMGIEIGSGIEIEIELYHRTVVTTINAGISNCKGKGRDRDGGLVIKMSQHRINKIREGISRMKGEISRMKGEISKKKGEISRMKGEISRMKGEIGRIRDKDRDDMMRSLSTNKPPNSIRDLGKMSHPMTHLIEIEITEEIARWAMIGNKEMVGHRAMIDNRAGTGSKAMTGIGVSIDSRAATTGTCTDLQILTSPIVAVEEVGDLLREEDQAAWTEVAERSKMHSLELSTKKWKAC